MPKAIGYFREGNPREEGEPSLSEQNGAFLEFCRREGFEVGATFLDTNSADDTGLRQMLEYLRQDGRGTTVVVDSLQRLGRDVRTAARAVFQLDGLGVNLIALDQREMTGKESATEALLASWTARAPSERAGDRVREAMRRKAVKGEVLGRAPFGYGVGRRRRLEPIPDEAALVRYMFRLYNQEGLGIRLIARRLNEEGYRTRRGGNWSMVTIRDILRNRVYLGTYARFGVRVPGSHSAIISPEDYRRAQDRMSRRRTAGGPRAPASFLLSGLVHCGYCNNRMIGVSRRQSWRRRGDGTSVQAEYRYYQCETRTNQSMCDYHTRRAAALEEEVRAGLERELRRELDAAEDRGAVDVEGDLKALRGRLRLLDRKLGQLLDAGAAGLMPAGEVREQSVEIAQQQLSLQAAIADLERRARLRQSEDQRRAEREDFLQALLPDPWAALETQRRQQLLQQLLLRVLVFDDSLQLIRRLP